MSKALSRKVAGLTLAAAAGFASLALFASPAQAHDADLAAKTACQTDGTWQVTWTVTHDQTQKRMWMTNIVFTPTGGSFEIRSRPGNDNEFPRVPWLGPKNSDKGSLSTTVTLKASTTETTLSYTANWKGADSKNNTLTVNRPPTCTPSASASASTSASASATPSASTSTAPPPALPVTGAPTGMLLAGGAVLVAGGAGMVLALRRRRRVSFVAE